MEHQIALMTTDDKWSELLQKSLFVKEKTLHSLKQTQENYWGGTHFHECQCSGFKPTGYPQEEDSTLPENLYLTKY